MTNDFENKTNGFWAAWHYFWDELPGRLRLLGKRLWAMGGSSRENVNPCHLSCKFVPILQRSSDRWISMEIWSEVHL